MLLGGIQTNEQLLQMLVETGASQDLTMKRSEVVRSIQGLQVPSAPG